MTAEARETESKIARDGRRSSGSMPGSVRLAVGVLLAVIVAGALYLLAVRGDALLADLAAIAALICG
ncbi:MAG: hypothetical protein KJ622_08465 [Alphaproteobacteria bacterium]|nr:hypothetical protein [Alphaproteobacteria bacterium]